MTSAERGFSVSMVAVGSGAGLVPVRSPDGASSSRTVASRCFVERCAEPLGPLKPVEPVLSAKERRSGAQAAAFPGHNRAQRTGCETAHLTLW